MSIQDVNTIANRLSLREPQRDSLKILDRVLEISNLTKGADTKQILEIIQSEFPAVKDFERAFPSLCFSLATGVGKTRLMGAFIAYLHRFYGVKNFFVVAPNLTIYNKLHQDFTQNTPKYVFKGISEFAQNQPEIVTGDNYESGLGAHGNLFSKVVINIFNIAKITAKDGGKLAKDDARRSVARVRRLIETIGESYFDFLASKEDLVVIMDESHRYRASAGWEALNDLKPVLGLELTATPQVERNGKSVPFKNVIYDYPLACAIRDGYVKEPAVATRENFNPKQYSADELEKIKLHDAVCIHESRKASLQIYADNKGVKTVKPFILVVATDTKHSAELKGYMESPEFFEGRYAGKILEINSATSGAEKDENIDKLLTVEDPNNPVEIVIHVNMLKEGWDVTNLYTIVPLRAANSKTLVEQSIGRGLRLPYGKRTGEPEVDTLTIVSHDKFQEIVDYANDPNSLIRKTVIVGKDVPESGTSVVKIENPIDAIINAASQEITPSAGGEESPIVSGVPQEKSIIERAAEKHKFESESEKNIARITKEIISANFENLAGVEKLSDEKVKERIVKEVKDRLARSQVQTEMNLDDTPKTDIEKTVQNTIGLVQETTINIPRVIITPKGESRRKFIDFKLNTSSLQKFSRVSRDITIRQLQSNVGFIIEAEELDYEETPERNIVSALMDLDDIPYDDNNSVINSIAKQYADFVRSYESDEVEVKKIVLFNRREIAKFLHDELFNHEETVEIEYQATVSKGFRIASSKSFKYTRDTQKLNFRNSAFTKKDIRNYLFVGYKKSLFPELNFDSDPERRFSAILEDSPQVLRWFKPTTNDIMIFYESGKEYEPDFIVETDNKMLLVEIKAEKDVNDSGVQNKASAAKLWCQYASEHALKNGGKAWKYLLIPDIEVLSNATLDALTSKFEK
ncbi:MAG: type III restriction endonuclease subunit R [Clostridia bacterium]|nr:MAG: type III restriction endonuclease subunit R [Clostridia bacterium]